MMQYWKPVTFIIEAYQWAPLLKSTLHLFFSFLVHELMLQRHKAGQVTVGNYHITLRL